MQFSKQRMEIPSLPDGETGKTCLMKALLNLKDGANPTIPLLLKIDQETKNPRPLINVACKDSFYKGKDLGVGRQH